jgi:hypothetical protein
MICYKWSIVSANPGEQPADVNQFQSFIEAFLTDIRRTLVSLGEVAHGCGWLQCCSKLWDRLDTRTPHVVHIPLSCASEVVHVGKMYYHTACMQIVCVACYDG